MKEYFAKQAQSKKKWKATSEQFGKEVDIEVRDQLLKLYLHIVCSKYSCLKYFINCEANKVVQIRKFQMQECGQSVFLSHKASFLIHNEFNSIKEYLNILFHGTTFKNVVGGKNRPLILDELTNAMLLSDFELKKEVAKKLKKKDSKKKAQEIDQFNINLF